MSAKTSALQGLLEPQVWVGDELHFPDCVLRVTAPREPCFKFNAVMGYPQAARDMVLAGCCGFYLAVDRPGTIEAGQAFTLVPGRRGAGHPAGLGRQTHQAPALSRSGLVAGRRPGWPQSR